MKHSQNLIRCGLTRALTTPRSTEAYLHSNPHKQKQCLFQVIVTTTSALLAIYHYHTQQMKLQMLLILYTPTIDPSQLQACCPLLVLELAHHFSPSACRAYSFEQLHFLSSQRYTVAIISLHVHGSVKAFPLQVAQESLSRG
jgi:hypothetical protein